MSIFKIRDAKFEFFGDRVTIEGTDKHTNQRVVVQTTKGVYNHWISSHPLRFVEHNLTDEELSFLTNGYLREKEISHE